MLGLREQVEPQRLGIGAARRRSRSGRSGPAKPSMPTSPDTWRLASCTHRLPGPDDHVDAPDRLGAVGERGDRLRAAHPVDLVDAAQRAAARITGCSPVAATHHLVDARRRAR